MKGATVIIVTIIALQLGQAHPVVDVTEIENQTTILYDENDLPKAQALLLCGGHQLQDPELSELCQVLADRQASMTSAETSKIMDGLNVAYDLSGPVVKIGLFVAVFYYILWLLISDDDPIYTI